MRKHATATLIAGLSATLLMLAPGLAWALGLGQIQSQTHIGQNLQAKIPILAASPGVLQGLTVSLAKPDAYRQAGIREIDFLFNLKFKIERGANGPYVLITSTEPVRLPFLNILVHAHWSSGDVTRQYTLLLNPPVFASSRSEQAQAPAPVAVPTTPQQQTPIARPTPPPAQVAQSSQPVPVVQQQSAPVQPARPGIYGPIQRGATLWSIAENLRSGATSVNQMMIAIYRANPQAFSGNINRLKAGATLHIPSRAEVAGVSRAQANTEVAKQVASWKTARAAPESRVAKRQTPVKKATGAKGGSGETAAGTGKATGSSAPAHAGEIVLTAPQVTQSLALGSAAASGRKNAGQSAGAATAAAGLAAAAGGLAGKKTTGGGSAGAGAVPAASAGGPAKIHNAELANLAVAGQAAAQKPASAGKQGVAANHGAQGKPAAGKAGKRHVATTSHAAAQTSAGERLSGTVWNWLTSIKGWVVIALIVLFLIWLVFLLVRRSRRDDRNLMALAAGASSDASARWREEPVFESSGPGVAVGEYTAGGGKDQAAEAGQPEELASESRAEAVVSDAQAEAELHASRGDYTGAAAVLSAALATAPECNGLRLRLLEMLFAADDGPGFRAQAETLHRRVPESGADWRSVAVMGRELLPGDPLFAAEAVAAGAESLQEAAPTNFELELDQLDKVEPVAGGLSDEFERTLGELSTMIETYMPESGERPVELHFPSAEDGSFSTANGENLELVGVPDSGSEGVETGPYFPGSDLEAAEAANRAPEDRTNGANRLELVQAYLDMDDPKSARATLESLVAEGGGPESERARQMLDVMDGKPDDLLGAVPGGEALELEAGPFAEEDLPVEADESGTAMDLARAYLELGDRESARDILEEVLDGANEPQRAKARELLETLN